jgi:hypothetical protein
MGMPVSGLNARSESPTGPTAKVWSDTIFRVHEAAANEESPGTPYGNNIGGTPDKWLTLTEFGGIPETTKKEWLLLEKNVAYDRQDKMNA